MRACCHGDDKVTCTTGADTNTGAAAVHARLRELLGGDGGGDGDGDGSGLDQADIEDMTARCCFVESRHLERPSAAKGTDVDGAGRGAGAGHQGDGVLDDVETSSVEYVAKGDRVVQVRLVLRCSCGVLVRSSFDDRGLHLVM